MKDSVSKHITFTADSSSYPIIIEFVDHLLCDTGTNKLGDLDGEFFVGAGASTIFTADNRLSVKNILK
jgi:hypothetical protein